MKVAVSRAEVNELKPGTVLDGYRIERPISAGGLSIVYRAVELETGRQVAIKEYLPSGIAERNAPGPAVRPTLASDKTAFEHGLVHFREEAHALIRIRHPNVVRVLRYFEANGTAYTSMEYVDGESLNAILRRIETLPPGELDLLLAPLLDGLTAIHTAGCLHRELKPMNILIRRLDGQPVILGFAAAQQAAAHESQSLSSVVRQDYMPFELYGLKPLPKESADIYSLGATLYRCVTGEPPMPAPERILAKIRNHPDPMPPARERAKGKYSPRLLAAIDAALAVDAEERPQDVAAFRALLGPITSAATEAGFGAEFRQRYKEATDKDERVVHEDAGNARRRAVRIAVVVAALLVMGLAIAYWR